MKKRFVTQAKNKTANGETADLKAKLWAAADKLRGHGKLMDIPPVVLYKDQKVTTFSDMEVDWKYSFIYSTRHFIDAYFKGEPPSLTAEQGREILRFALAAQQSAQSGQSVKL